MKKILALALIAGTLLADNRPEKGHGNERQVNNDNAYWMAVTHFLARSNRRGGGTDELPEVLTKRSYDQWAKENPAAAAQASKTFSALIKITGDGSEYSGGDMVNSFESNLGDSTPSDEKRTLKNYQYGLNTDLTIPVAGIGMKKAKDKNDPLGRNEAFKIMRKELQDILKNAGTDKRVKLYALRALRDLHYAYFGLHDSTQSQKALNSYGNAIMDVLGLPHQR